MTTPSLDPFTTEPSDEWKAMVRVFRRDLRRCRDDVLRLKRHTWRLPFLFSFASLSFGAVGIGAAGLLDSPSPTGTREIIFWCFLIGGLAGTVAFALGGWVYRKTYSEDIDRASEQIDALNY